MTNADRIRAMTDEELAETITEHCRGNLNCNRHTGPDGCYCCWLETLKQEAEE